MDKKNKIEEFNSTEIDVEQIKKPDSSDEWEFVSVFEADSYSVPYISVPGRNKYYNELGEVCCESSLERAFKDQEKISPIHDGILATLVTKNLNINIQDNSSSDKQIDRKSREMAVTAKKKYQCEQNQGKHLRKVEKTLQEKVVLNELDEEAEFIRREFIEAMGDELIPRQQEQKNEKARGVDDARLELICKKPEHEKRQFDKSLSEESRKELDRLWAETAELNKRIKERRIQEDIEEAIEEAMQETPYKAPQEMPQYEQKHERFQLYGQQLESRKIHSLRKFTQPNLCYTKNDKEVKAYQNIPSATGGSKSKSGATEARNFPKVLCGYEQATTSKFEIGTKIKLPEFPASFVWTLTPNIKSDKQATASKSESGATEENKLPKIPPGWTRASKIDTDEQATAPKSESDATEVKKIPAMPPGTVWTLMPKK